MANKNQAPTTAQTPEVSPNLTRKDIDVRHPDWLKRKEQWTNTYVLYEGGQLMWEQRGAFLKQRPQEDTGLYNYRLDHFCYENNLGTGLGWHEAEMFKAPPAITFKLKGKDGKPSDAQLPKDQEDFYSRFLQDCDRQGTNLVDKFRQCLTDLMLYGRSYVLTDIPPAQPAQSLADQKKSGQLDPYTVVVCPLEVINWETDELGNLTWAVIYRESQRREFGKKPVRVERWYYYDRQNFAVYEATSNPDEVGMDKDDQPVKMIKSGKHVQAAQNTLPLRRYNIPAGWWMGNRTYLACMEHLNLSNALKWSLFMAALAVPVVITDVDISSLRISEGGFVALPVGSDYKYAEPEGKCWEHMAARIEVLKEEIYRSMYLIAQARTNKATASAQSGVSKEQDMKPSHDVLNGIGDILRGAMQQTLLDVAAVRASLPGTEADANILPDVRGFEFDDAVTVEDIDKLVGIHGLAVPSKKFEKEVDKLTVQAVLPDLNPDTQEEIFNEIDAAPTRSEIEEQKLDQQAQRMAQNLESSVNH